MPQPGSWMLIRLALETKAHHASADADRLALLDSPRSAPDGGAMSIECYRAFLEKVYTFEAPYEQALVQTPGLDPSIVRRRVKVHRLRADLLALGVQEADLAAWPRAPIAPFGSEPEALGWMYVVERNTLLHGLLRRHLARTLPSTIELAGSYLGAYGDTPGAYYRDLGYELDDAARRRVPSTIVEGAHDAFLAQRRWFQHAHATRRVAA